MMNTDSLIEVLRKYKQAFQEKSVADSKRCIWKVIEGVTFNDWITSCGRVAILELEYKYCPYCGLKIKKENRNNLDSDI